MMKHDGRLQ